VGFRWQQFLLFQDFFNKKPPPVQPKLLAMAETRLESFVILRE